MPTRNRRRGSHAIEARLQPLIPRRGTPPAETLGSRKAPRKATASMTGGKPCTDSLPTDSPVQQSASGCRGMRNGLRHPHPSQFPLHFGTCLPPWDFPDPAPRRKDPNWQECPQPAGKHTQKVSQSAGMSPTAGKRPRRASQYGGSSPTAGKRPRGLAEDGGKSQNGGQRPRGLAQDGGKRPKRRQATSGLRERVTAPGMPGLRRLGR